MSMENFETLGETEAGNHWFRHVAGGTLEIMKYHKDPIYYVSFNSHLYNTIKAKESSLRKAITEANSQYSKFMNIVEIDSTESTGWTYDGTLEESFYGKHISCDLYRSSGKRMFSASITGGEVIGGIGDFTDEQALAWIKHTSRTREIALHLAGLRRLGYII